MDGYCFPANSIGRPFRCRCLGTMPSASSILQLFLIRLKKLTVLCRRRSPVLTLTYILFPGRLFFPNDHLTEYPSPSFIRYFTYRPLSKRLVRFHREMSAPAPFPRPYPAPDPRQSSVHRHLGLPRLLRFELPA